MGEEVIRLKNIKKSYGKKEVLTDVNLSIDKGDIFGLIPDSGLQQEIRKRIRS